MRIYGLLYGCITAAFGLILWFAWARAHMLYMLPGWVHRWVLPWLPFALLVVGIWLAGTSLLKQRDIGLTGEPRCRQRRWQSLEPFLLAGIILLLIGLVALALWIRDSMSVT